MHVLSVFVFVFIFTVVVVVVVVVVGVVLLSCCLVCFLLFVFADIISFALQEFHVEAH